MLPLVGFDCASVVNFGLCAFILVIYWVVVVLSQNFRTFGVFLM